MDKIRHREPVGFEWEILGVNDTHFFVEKLTKYQLEYIGRDVSLPSLMLPSHTRKIKGNGVGRVGV